MVTREVDISRSTPLFLKEAQHLVNTLQRFSIEELKEIYNASAQIAKSNYERLHHLSKKTPAIFSYTGAQFKALDVSSLDNVEISYLQAHTRIISGMFGLLRALDDIFLYRLPMETKVGTLSLYNYWTPLIGAALKNQTLVSLASGEYEKVLYLEYLNVTTVSFVHYKNNKKKVSSMELKKMRGLFLRHCALHQINQLEKLKEISLEGYVFSNALSTKNQFVYVKKES